MLPMVISPTNSRLGHLLMTCSTAAAVSPGGRPCLPAKAQGDQPTHQPSPPQLLPGHAHVTESHSLSSPLVLTCTMTFSFWDDPFFCHELLTLSASFTESTVSNMNRFGTAGERTG